MDPVESQTNDIDCLPADMTLPPSWQGRSVAGPKLRLVEMSAFVERKTFAEASFMQISLQTRPVFIAQFVIRPLFQRFFVRYIYTALRIVNTYSIISIHQFDCILRMHVYLYV